MAALTSFAITIALSGSVTNPINSTSFQAIAPWGKSSVRTSPREALEDIIYRAGNEWAGKMGQYFASQTLNGASGSGPTGYTNANEVGIP